MSKLAGKWKGVLLYLTAAALWSVNGSVSKTLLATGIEASRLSQLRATAAFLVLAVVVTVRKRSAWRIQRRQELGVLALYGVVGLALTHWLYFLAIWLLPVGVALVLEFTAPFLVALWVRFVRQTEISRVVWVGLAVALAGLVLITELWNGFSLNAVGVTAGIGAALAFSVYFLAGERALNMSPPRDSLSVSMWGFAFATGFWSLLLPWWDFPWQHMLSGSELTPGFIAPNWQLATFMVIGGTVLPFWSALLAMRYLPSQQAAAIGMLEPVLASVVAFLLLGELLSLWQLIGGAVTLIGVALAEFARNSGPKN